MRAITFILLFLLGLVTFAEAQVTTTKPITLPIASMGGSPLLGQLPGGRTVFGPLGHGNHEMVDWVQTTITSDSLSSHRWEARVVGIIRHANADTSAILDIRAIPHMGSGVLTSYRDTVVIAPIAHFFAIPTKNVSLEIGINRDSLYLVSLKSIAPKVGDGFYIGRSYVAPLGVDAMTNAVMTIDYAHHETHAGSSYELSADSSLAGANDSLELFILPPTGNKKYHLVWDVRATAECYFYIKTGVTVSAAADTVTAVNHDWSSAKTSNAIGIKAPRSSNTGTYVRTMELIGSDHNSGGETRGVFERILNPGDNYVFGVHSTAAAVVSIHLNWYEHTGRD
jgi:hypothetical protein